MKYFDEQTKTEVYINCDVDSWFEEKRKSLKVQGSKADKVLKAETLLRAASKEYRRGDLSLDELSCITEQLFGSFTVDEKMKAELSDLIYVLEIGTDLSYYERYCINHLEKNDFAKHLKLVLEYQFHTSDTVMSSKINVNHNVTPENAHLFRLTWWMDYVYDPEAPEIANKDIKEETERGDIVLGSCATPDGKSMHMVGIYKRLNHLNDRTSK